MLLTPSVDSGLDWSVSSLRGRSRRRPQWSFGRADSTRGFGAWSAGVFSGKRLLRRTAHLGACGAVREFDTEATLIPSPKEMLPLLIHTVGHASSISVMSIRSTTLTRCRHWRWRFLRRRRRRYLRARACRFSELWWYSTWLYLGFMAVLSAFLADEVSGEPTVVVLCVAMILTVQNLKTNQVVSILTGVLGILAALLAFPEQSGVDALNRGPWIILGVLIGVSAFSTLVFVRIVGYVSALRRRKRMRR